MSLAVPYWREEVLMKICSYPRTCIEGAPEGIPPTQKQMTFGNHSHFAVFFLKEGKRKQPMILPGFCL